MSRWSLRTLRFGGVHRKRERTGARRHKETKGFVQQAAFEGRETKAVVLTFLFVSS